MLRKAKSREARLRLLRMKSGSVSGMGLAAGDPAGLMAAMLSRRSKSFRISFSMKRDEYPALRIFSVSE